MLFRSYERELEIPDPGRPAAFVLELGAVNHRLEGFAGPDAARLRKIHDEVTAFTGQADCPVLFRRAFDLGEAPAQAVLGSYRHPLEVFREAERHREAIELLSILFGTWLEHDGTAMPECGRPADFADGRIGDDIEVHAYGLGALALFHTRILGVQPAEPGYARVRIAPCPGGLAWARGTTRTPRGLVRVEWRVEDRTFRCHAEGPAGVELDLAPPSGLTLPRPVRASSSKQKG